MDTGMKARVRPTIIEGEITDKRFDAKTGEKFLTLTWTDGVGEEQHREFGEGDLEAIAADAPTA